MILNLTPNYVALVTKLRAQRKFYNYSQAGLSKELRKKSDYIRNIENFEKMVHKITLKKLIKFLASDDKEEFFSKRDKNKRCKRCWIVLDSTRKCLKEDCKQFHGESPDGKHCLDCYVRFIDKSSEEYEPSEATQAPYRALNAS